MSDLYLIAEEAIAEDLVAGRISIDETRERLKRELGLDEAEAADWLGHYGLAGGEL